MNCEAIHEHSGGSVRFQITREELDDLVRSKKTTSPERAFFQGQSGGTRYLPWCFTESGVYMLMTVLRGDLAIKQSKALIRIFRSMKEYILRHRGIQRHNAIYDDCISDSFEVYLYTILRCAHMRYSHVENYFRFMVK